MLVDSHCHLDFPDFKDEIDDIIKRAADNNVGIMQTICTHISKFPQIIEIANKYDNIFASVGIHPHEAAKESTTIEELVRLATHKKIIGIGETGLDYFYEHSPRIIQQESLLIHIEAARQTGLPLIVHTRDADDDTIEILQNEMKKGEFKFLIHCFSSTRHLADKTLELGGYISISGIVTFKKCQDLRDIVKDIPLDRILVETDAPFLAPAPHRGKRNEPAFVKYTAEIISQVKNIPYKEVEKVTTDNFLRLFDRCKFTKY